MSESARNGQSPPQGLEEIFDEGLIVLQQKLELLYFQRDVIARRIEKLAHAKLETEEMREFALDTESLMSVQQELILSSGTTNEPERTNLQQKLSIVEICMRRQKIIDKLVVLLKNLEEKIDFVQSQQIMLQAIYAVKRSKRGVVNEPRLGRQNPVYPKKVL